MDSSHNLKPCSPPFSLLTCTPFPYTTLLFFSDTEVCPIPLDNIYWRPSPSSVLGSLLLSRSLGFIYNFSNFR